MARQGVLDLRYPDWARVWQVTLDGEWEFQPGPGAKHPPASPYRQVPDLWEGDTGGADWGQGYGTYRLRVLLPADHPELALRWTTVATAFELDVNGATLASAGLPRPDPAIARPAYRPGLVALADPGRVLELEIRVSNHEYRGGGLWRAFRLGDRARLEQERRTGETLSTILASFTAAVGFTYLMLYLFRRQAKSYLWFALFALTIVLRPLVTGDYLILALWPDLPFELLIRLEYCTAFLPFPLAIAMFITLYPEFGRLRDHKFMLVPFLPFVACIPVLPLPWLTRLIFLYYLACLPPVMGTLRLMYRALARRLPGSRLTTLGGLVLLGTAVNDALYASFIINTANLVPWGVTAYVWLQSIALGQNYAHAHKRMEHLVLEVHHRVKNSLQIVSSLLGLHAMRTTDPGAKEAFRFMKDKIRAVSLVHEKLYSVAGQEEAIPLGRYLEELAGHLVHGYSADQSGPRLRLQVTNPPVPAGFCMDCGLMLSELVSNAFKHHPEPARLVLDLRLYPDGRDWLVLEVGDNGPGFPPGLELAKSPGQGLSLVATLAGNHQGSLSLHRNGLDGALVRVRLRPAGRS